MKSSFAAFLFVLLAILITLGEQGVAADRWWYPSSPPPPPQNGWVWTWPWPVYSYPPPPTAVKPPSHHDLTLVQNVALLFKRLMKIA
ncbi:hypothetical protein GOBAR_AA19842 [Gossypium barbadense]|uniref:Extensin domain-containing protein n=1 Tax=Gossypium barbadense TaxID=3634 RepID=A0A2P5XBZ4_GOSBA|nr:hypothetical protein GOBAR_AA19842 [Gossypium barbadense]